jgi:type I restriction enzyme S subunit
MLDKAKNRGANRPYLRNVNVRWFGFELDSLLEMRFEESELDEFSLRPGDVLACEGGEPGRAAVWQLAGKGIYFQKAIHRIRFSSEVEPQFFVNALRAAADDSRLASFFTGAGIKHLTGKGLAAFTFPVPPLAEQHRIVAKVDELMALCDLLEAAQKEREGRRDRLVVASLVGLNQPLETSDVRKHGRFTVDHLRHMTSTKAHLKLMRQSIIDLAVRGQLVPQDPSDEPPMLPEKSDYSQGSLPAGWRRVPLAALLAEDTRNGFSLKPDEPSEGTPILRISACTIRADGLVAEEEHKLMSGIEPGVRVQYGLRSGDLLACRFNGNKSFVGRLAIFEDRLGIRPIFPDKLIRIRLAPRLVVPAFVRMAGDSNIVRDQIAQACATTVGNWGISASNLKDVRFPVPPVAEQGRIVAKINELMTVCDRLEAQLEAGRAARAKLLEVILRDALAEGQQGSATTRTA